MTRLLTSETIPVRTEPDILLVRQLVKERATELNFSVLDQTKLVTAASELGRNTLIHGGGGTMLLVADLRVAVDRKGEGDELSTMIVYRPDRPLAQGLRAGHGRHPRRSGGRR